MNEDGKEGGDHEKGGIVGGLWEAARGLETGQKLEANGLAILLCKKKVGGYLKTLGPEEAWSEFMAGDSRETSRSEWEERQLDHTRSMAAAEGGDVTEAPRSFGLYWPGYRSLLLPGELKYLAKLSKVSGLLLGSMSHHSAHEFAIWMRMLNSQASSTVVDLGRSSLETTDSRIGRIQGDVIKLPLPDQSQDVVATNFLLRCVGSKGKTRGEAVVGTLVEAMRVLRPRGVLLMLEEALPFSQNYGTTWLSRLMLEETLQQMGGQEVRSDFAVGFRSQRDKRGGED